MDVVGIFKGEHILYRLWLYKRNITLRLYTATVYLFMQLCVFLLDVNAKRIVI